MIQQTMNYDIFKKIDKNREIHEDNVRRLIRSIKFKNLLSRKPIEVNPAFEVLDGQHRLEAAKRLKIPIHYEIKENLTIDEICILGASQREWKHEDYLNLHMKSNNPHYVRLFDFMSKNSLTMSNAVATLGGVRMGKFAVDFKLGKFQCSPEQIEEAQDIVDKSRRIVDYLAPKLIDMKYFITGARFQRCLFILMSHKEFDMDMFMKKLGYKMELIRPASRLEEVLEYLKKIYNYRSPQPLIFS